MAGQAQKKAKKAMSETGAFYWKVILVVNALYLAWLAYQIQGDTVRWQGMKAWGWGKRLLFPGLTVFFYALAYHGLVHAAASRVSSSSTYVDLLGLTVAAQLGSTITPYAWMLYWVVPVAAVYLYVLPMLGMLRGMFGGGGGEEGGGGESAGDAAKRQAKKERKASRAQVVRG